MKKLNKIITMIMILVISIGVVEVQASTGTVSLKSSSNSVSKGDTFTVTVSATCDEEINGLIANITYDTNALTLDSANVTSSKWSNMSGTNDKLAIIANQRNINSDDIYTLTFKVKDNATAGETTIKASSIELDSSTTTKIADQSVKVTIQGSNNNTNTGTNSNNSETITTTIAKDNTTAKSAVPKTGEHIAIIFGIAIFAIIAIIMYSKYRKSNI